MCKNEVYSLVQELTNHFSVEELNDKETEIRILIPKKYKFLWLHKLSELSTTPNEINEFDIET